MTLLALSAIYILCKREVSNGFIGVELYYGRMLEYIAMTVLIVWCGMFIYDIVEKEYTDKNEC